MKQSSRRVRACELHSSIQRPAGDASQGTSRDSRQRCAVEQCRSSSGDIEQEHGSSLRRDSIMSHLVRALTHSLSHPPTTDTHTHTHTHTHTRSV